MMSQKKEKIEILDEIKIEQMKYAAFFFADD